MSGAADAADNSQELGSDEATNFSTLYLGYGSNLSPKTMKQRCPDSIFVGLARLDDWRFMIHAFGFANIVKSPGDVVYGGLYFLSARDEKALDLGEGVPWEYERRMVEVTRFGKDLGEAEGQKVTALTYIDFQRVEDGKIDEDYVFWMRRAMEDGLKIGVPAEYFDKYVKPVTPELNRGYHDMNMFRMGT